MTLPSLTTEIDRAMGVLGLDPGALRMASLAETRETLPRVQQRFIANPAKDSWWWQDLGRPGVSAEFVDGRACRRLAALTPSPRSAVWLICNDNARDRLLLYDGTPDVIQTVLAECFGFEYMLADKSLAWSLAETHEGVLVALGSPAMERFRAFIAENPAEVRNVGD